MQSFNVAGQGPFPVMIEDISSRNSLLLLSNVLLLSVTDLLQREDCCCYKSEDLLKKRMNQLDAQLDQANLFQKLQALTITSCEDSESLSSSVLESLTPSFQSYSPWSHFNASTLQNLSFSATASESHLREQSQPSYCAVFFLFSLSPCTLSFYSLGLTSFVL